MDKNHNRHFLLLVFLLLGLIFSFISNNVSAQYCNAGTPTYTVDLSSNPDSIWILPQGTTVRDSFCCSSMDPCIQFIVTLNPIVGGLFLGVLKPDPMGAMTFEINCDSSTITQAGQILCTNGSGPFSVTVCKPGGDQAEYTIAGIGKGEASPPVTIRDGCSDTIWAVGFQEPSLIWTSIPDDSVLNSFLSCRTGCDTVFVTPTGLFPDSVRYQVCGNLAGLSCAVATQKCDTVTVYFINTLSVQIAPQNPSICAGGLPVTLTSTPNGGKPPYSYLWNTGETTSTILVPSGSAGAYWVFVNDSTECQPASDTVVVFEFTQVITANAGPDDTICNTSSTVNLSGSVTGVTTGIWTGGTGSFFPSSSTLNATYLPAGIEITSGSVTLTLITTNTGSCPLDSDAITIYFVPPPIVSAGLDDSICDTSPVVSLTGSVTNAAGGIWSTLGSGSFAPSTTTMTPTYTASVSDISNGIVSILLTTTGSACPPARDTVDVYIGKNDVVVDAGNNQSVCSNVASVQLTGTVTSANPLIGGVWTTNGTGSFSPDSMNLNAVYIPSPADTIATSVTITLTSINNGDCAPIDSSMTITFLPTTIVYAGADTTLCGSVTSLPVSGTFSNAAGIVWSSSGLGVFTPSNTLPTATYSFDSLDFFNSSVQLILSAVGGCSAMSDTAIVTFIPSVTAGADASVCFNDSDIVLSGTSNSSLGGGVVVFWLRILPSE